ncbi:MAG: hypothetical protein WC819_05125, partial [Parcubacteria group bacterium]
DTNQSMQVTRVFRITDPDVTIEPVSGASRKVLGTYRNLKKEEFTDESDKTFIAQEGQTVTLEANLYPGFLNNQEDTTTYQWTLDGENYSTDKTISFVPDGTTSVGLRVVRSIAKKDRKALRGAFGISQEESIPTTFSSSVQIVIDQDSIVQNKGITGFFASISYNTPFYLLFILKMALIMSIMLFVPSLVLGAGKTR